MIRHLVAGCVGVQYVDVDIRRGDKIIPERLTRLRAAVTLPFRIDHRHPDGILDDGILGVEPQPSLTIFTVHILA